jgi:hypothetical protein
MIDLSHTGLYHITKSVRNDLSFVATEPDNELNSTVFVGSVVLSSFFRTLLLCGAVEPDALTPQRSPDWHRYGFTVWIKRTDQNEVVIKTSDLVFVYICLCVASVFVAYTLFAQVKKSGYSKEI